MNCTDKEAIMIIHQPEWWLKKYNYEKVLMQSSDDLLLVC